MLVVKKNGDQVEFDPNKIKESLKRTGANIMTVKKVMDQVVPQVKEGMTTTKIYKMVFDALEKESICYACRYTLRSALLKLGPAGFKFEKYIVSILRAYGFDAMNPRQELQGACVKHEVDVIAEKDGKTVFIEAKFRNRYNDYVNLKDIMATWSRFIDLLDGADEGRERVFHEVWIVTNARFSDRAKQFGLCKGMKLIGWKFPEDNSFGKMVDSKALYPITVIDGLKKNELESFSKQGLTLCKEVTELEPQEIEERVGIHAERAGEIINICQKVIDPEKK